MTLAELLARASANDPSIAKLVKFVNDRFVQPMFDPSLSGVSQYEPKSVVFGLDRFPTPETVRATLRQLLGDPSYATFRKVVRRYGQGQALSIIATPGLASPAIPLRMATATVLPRARRTV
ncbi:MAG: hypothetical protein IMX02_13435 [Limnochordaceae bacterium]|nr:hypothetical protein [Limnochordaceae bacterium]